MSTTQSATPVTSLRALIMRVVTALIPVIVVILNSSFHWHLTTAALLSIAIPVVTLILAQAHIQGQTTIAAAIASNINKRNTATAAPVAFVVTANNDGSLRVAPTTPAQAQLEQATLTYPKQPTMQAPPEPPAPPTPPDPIPPDPTPPNPTSDSTSTSVS